MTQTTTTVERAQVQAVRFDAWRSVFEKTNRIISGRPIKVEIQQGANPNLPPSWTDGETVTFNGYHVAEMLRTTRPLDAVLRLKGLNYHELSHVLYSPRATDELARLVLKRVHENADPTTWKAFNALEDQRIETWFTASYGTSRRYFEAIILQWLVKDGNTEAAILLHGRKYLPAKLRMDAGDIFAKKYGGDLLRRFQRVIDDYLTVVLPGDTQRAFTLVKAYRDLLREIERQGGRLPKAPVPDNGCESDHGVTETGRVKTGRTSYQEARTAQAKAAKSAAEADAEDEAYLSRKAQEAAEDAADADDLGDEPGEDGEGADGDGQGASAEGDAAGEGGDESGQDGSGQGGDQPGEGSSEGVSADAEGDSSEDVGSGGSGAGGGAAEHEVLGSDADLADAMRDLIEAAHDGLDDIAADEAVVQDVEKVLDAVNATVSNGDLDAEGGLASHRATVAPSESDLQVLRRVVQTLTKIRLEAEPQVLRRQVTGRVDVRRAVTRRPNEVDVFTQYDEGDEEATGVDAVVLLDVSGSMSGASIIQASTAMWVLKRAFDKVGIRATVLAYDTHHQVVWQGREKAQSIIPVLSARGGTDPQSALEQAALILRKSHAANRVLVTITDGGWQSNPEAVRGLMKAMHKDGVVSLILGIGAAWGWDDEGNRVPSGVITVFGKHDHQEGHDLPSIRALPGAVLKLVAGVMRGSLERAV